MIKALLFDFDGTLADTNELIFKSFRHVLDNNGYNDVSDKIVYGFFGEPLHKTLGRYSKSKSVDELIEEYREFNNFHHDSMIKPFETVSETLKYFKDKGYKLAVVTSKYERLARHGAKCLGIEDYFDIFVTPADTNLHKPDKEPVEFACNKLNIAPKEAIMVGDSNFDIMSGKSAGAYTAAVNYSLLERDILLNAEPDFFINNLSDLKEIVTMIDEKEMKDDIIE